MTTGGSVVALRTRHKLYKLLHQDGGEDESSEEQTKREKDEMLRTTELLVEADPSLSQLIHRQDTRRQSRLLHTTCHL